MSTTDRAARDQAVSGAAERPDLAAWRRRHELRRSNGAQPIRNKKVYSRTVKHRQRY
ncbi:hypothetical protein BJY24_006793 [Nocardia transvalensis]|uniref:Uncharacterized protein n=1 Tax=Nocardia transvalensis TaxID=37333 RepID=A0A7W9ULS8_9NOCA|nr:hypothetical protein [Nocardia transvalensis]MBB5917881.1 hypothetical protein [Nocardia transvalensis]